MKARYFAVGVLFGAALGGMVSCAAVREDALRKDQAPAPYVIGAEDVLDIYVWKEDTLSRTVTVRMDGKISLPLIDEVRAAGLTPLQLKDELTRRFREYVDLPNVSVMVGASNSSRVTVSGRLVNQIVPLRSPLSMMQFMIMVGGTNARKVLVIRNENGKENRYSLNYTKILKGTEPDFVLKSGDTVIIQSESTWVTTGPSATTPTAAIPPVPNPFAIPPPGTTPAPAATAPTPPASSPPATAK